MEMKQLVGKRIKQARKRLGLTQQALADLIPGCIDTRISNYERGDREPDAAMLMQLAAVLHCPVSFFYGVADLEELTKDELVLLNKYRQSDQAGKDTLQRVAEHTAPQNGAKEQAKLAS